MPLPLLFSSSSANASRGSGLNVLVPCPTAGESGLHSSSFQAAPPTNNGMTQLLISSGTSNQPWNDTSPHFKRHLRPGQAQGKTPFEIEGLITLMYVSSESYTRHLAEPILNGTSDRDKPEERRRLKLMVLKGSGILQGATLASLSLMHVVVVSIRRGCCCC